MSPVTLCALSRCSSEKLHLRPRPVFLLVSLHDLNLNCISLFVLEWQHCSKWPIWPHFLHLWSGEWRQSFAKWPTLSHRQHFPSLFWINKQAVYMVFGDKNKRFFVIIPNKILHENAESQCFFTVQLWLEIFVFQERNGTISRLIPFRPLRHNVVLMVSPARMSVGPSQRSFLAWSVPRYSP